MQRELSSRVFSIVVIVTLLSGMASPVGNLVAEEMEPSRADRSEAFAAFYELGQRWNRQRSQLQSMQVTGKLFFAVAGTEAGFTLDQAETLFHELEQIVARGEFQQSEFEKRTSRIFLGRRDPERPELPSGNWRTFSFVCDGPRHKFIEKLPLIEMTIVDSGNGEELHYNSASKQATVQRSPSPISSKSIADFVYTPFLSLKKTDRDAEEHELKKRDRLHWLIESRNIQLSYDPTTAFVWKNIVSIPGQILEWRRQSLMVLDATGVPIPKLSMRVEFHKTPTGSADLVRLIEVTIVDNFEVNLEVEDSQFELEVPTGATLVSVSDEGTRAVTRANFSPVKLSRTVVEDLVQHPRRPEKFALQAVSVSERNRNWPRMLILLNILVLAGVCAYYLQKKCFR